MIKTVTLVGEHPGHGPDSRRPDLASAQSIRPCQTWLVLSGNAIRSDSVVSLGESNRQSSTLVACSEKERKVDSGIADGCA